MSCDLTESELWSGLDRNAPEIQRHLDQCARCKDRAAALRAGMGAVVADGTPERIPLPERIGPYAVLRRLGQGGMGIVYEAEQQHPRRSVAIKVIRGGPYVDEYRVRLFQREAQTLGRLRHPNIAAIFEGGQTDDGQPFIVMELVRGQPLTQYCRDGDLPRNSRLRLFQRVCGALNYAHQRGVIHRDIKPSNILVDADGNPRILDFGLARISDPDEAFTMTSQDVGRLMGTLPYLSPEEARGRVEDIDVRTDVYSLGVILFELLTGQLPYAVSRTALPESVRAICEEPPKPPRSIDRSLRGDLDTIALKALEKDPGRRYETVAALSDDLNRYLTDQPIHARPAGFVYRLRKLIARRRLSVTFLLALIVVLVAAFAWVQRIERNLQFSTQFAVDLQNLRTAVQLHSFAKRYQELGDLSRAEQEYRAALATFRRLERDDYVADACLGLGWLLVDRNESSGFADAEALLDEALTIYGRHPYMHGEAQRSALRALQKLYGPERWAEPGALMQIEQELAGLEDRLIHGPPDPAR